MKITPEALIEIGFVETEIELVLYLQKATLSLGFSDTVYLNNIQTNATTIEDIKDLIRLFK
jgi:hypothetical protein